MLAYSTFPANEYHRACVISLLCSEWEEVGHARLNHQGITKGNFGIRGSGRPARLASRLEAGGGGTHRNETPTTKYRS